MTALPPVAPALVSATVDGLAGRLRRRADALAADRHSWTLRTVDGGLEIDLGEVVTVHLPSPADVVTEPDQVRCGCLLAPGCAHRAAVLLASPVADPPGRRGEETAAEDGSSAGGPVGVAKADDLSAAPEQTARRLDPDQRGVLDLVGSHLALLLTGGVHRADAEIVGALTADLQRLRVHHLVIAERALTGVLQGIEAVRREVTRPARTDLVRSLGVLLLNLHSLRRADADGSVDEELLGRERRSYHLVGGLTLHPACVEPVRTGSGFAGVVVTLVDTQGRIWTLARIAPSDLAGIGQRYAAGVDWGGLSCDVRALSRSTLVVSGATASDTGRLGGGRGVRASLTGTAAPAWERLCLADDRWQVIEGEIAGGGPTNLLLDTAGGRVDLSHTPGARRDADGLALLARARGARVRALVRSEGAGRALLGIRPLDDLITPAVDLEGTVWPGLDLVRRDWFGDLHHAGPEVESLPGEAAVWLQAPSSVREVLARWLTRTALDGAGAIRGGSASLERDVRGLRAGGAPFAADLLDGLATAARAGEVTDGRWTSDGTALVRAWLALDQY